MVGPTFDERGDPDLVGDDVGQAPEDAGHDRCIRLVLDPLDQAQDEALLEDGGRPSHVQEQVVQDLDAEGADRLVAVAHLRSL